MLWGVTQPVNKRGEWMDLVVKAEKERKRKSHQKTPLENNHKIWGQGVGGPVRPKGNPRLVLRPHRKNGEG